MRQKKVFYPKLMTRTALIWGMGGWWGRGEGGQMGSGGGGGRHTVLYTSFLCWRPQGSGARFEKGCSLHSSVTMLQMVSNTLTSDLISFLFICLNVCDPGQADDLNPLLNGCPQKRLCCHQCTHTTQTILTAEDYSVNGEKNIMWQNYPASVASICRIQGMANLTLRR